MVVINRMLFALTIVFIPFIASIGSPGMLGGMGTHLSFYPSFVMLFLFLVHCFVKRLKISVPNTPSFIFLMLFSLWLLISGIVNIPNLLSVEFKGTVGISRFIVQAATFFIFISFSIVFANCIMKLNNGIEFLERYLLYSFAIAGAYSLLELLLIVDFGAMKDIISAVNIFRASAGEKLYFGRIRSVASEASFFGMYAGIIMPWLIMKWLTAHKHKLIWGISCVYLLLLVVLSFSRTAYFITAIEICFIVFLFRREIKNNIRQIVVFLVVLLIVAFGILDQFGDLFTFDVMEVITSFFTSNEENKHLTSDLTRIGSQYAALKLFLDNPFCGVGFGAFGFYAPDYYPHEAWNSWEIKELGSNSINGAWPPVHGIYVRILAELGFPGIVFWLGFLGYLVFGLYKKSKVVSDEILKIKIRALLVSIIGCMMFGFNVDAFAVIGLWVFASFGWSIIQEKKCENREQLGENNV